MRNPIDKSKVLTEQKITQHHKVYKTYVYNTKYRHYTKCVENRTRHPKVKELQQKTLLLQNVKILESNNKKRKQRT